MTSTHASRRFPLHARPIATDPAQRLFVAMRYLGAEFVVMAHHDDLAAELPHYLIPHAHGPAGPDAWTIHLLHEDDSELGVVSASASTGRLAVRTEGSGALTITDWRERVRWHVARRTTDPRRFVQDVYCGIRRLGLASLPTAALLHAPAVQVRGTTVVFLGHEVSARRHHVQQLVVSERAGLVAADKLCVWSVGHELRAAGLIDAVRTSLDPDGVGVLGAAGAWGAWAQPQEPADGVPAPVHARDEAWLPPRRYADAAGIEIVALTRPDVFVLLAPSSAPATCARLEAAEARAALHAHVIEDACIDGARGLGPAGAVTLAAIATACPMYVLRGRGDRMTLGDLIGLVLA